MQDNTRDDTVITGARFGEPDFADTIIVAVPPQPAANPVLSVVRDNSAPLLHYRLRIGGEIVGLDKVAYLGRRPSVPRVMLDGVPRLIQVSSPLYEVSSTHLEIRQRGTSVVITDLRSTNGSLVNIPGCAPRKLCRGESLVVTAGTVVDIGDGNLVEILPMQRV